MHVAWCCVSVLKSDPKIPKSRDRRQNLVATNYQFARRLWAYMSHFPINANEFIPSDRFAAVFGSGVKKWDDLRSLLSDHVFFNSSYVGVFSGKKLRF